MKADDNKVYSDKKISGKI